jgi:integrase
MHLPAASTVIREHGEQVFFEAKFRHDGKQVKRRIGPAWLERNGEGWRPRKGRVPDGYFDKQRAVVAGAGIVAEYVAEAANIEKRRTRGVTFREVAESYMERLANVRGAKPSTIKDYESILAEPGTLRKRGGGTLNGHVMGALADRPAAKIETREIETLLAKIANTGASARTVNKYRSIILAVFNYGMREATFNLPTNPARGADKRREPELGVLAFYTSDEVEALARALADGRGRDRNAVQSWKIMDETREHMATEDRQDAELIRVAAYAGLRMGELLALRWRDIDFAGHALTISRAMSAGVESSTKSGKVRRVPLPDQAAGALDRLSRRQDFTGADELVFCNVLGRSLDGSALRRRFKRARDAAGLRPLRFHDLRHTYGSLLAASGVDLVTIKSAMGHADLATTGRYLHARPASEQAAIFTRAFESKVPDERENAFAK